jgi:hypothetical protein
MKYLSIKEAAALTGKSESSIKRFVNQVKTKEPDKYRDITRFKFEKLPNGNDKILISETYLIARFTRSKNELHDLVNSSKNTENTNGSHSSPIGSKSELHDLVVSSYQKTIEILQSELDQKNKQINELLENQREYLERQKESNILLLGNKQVLQLEEKPKRWWQRKK